MFLIQWNQIFVRKKWMLLVAHSHYMMSDWFHVYAKCYLALVGMMDEILYRECPPNIFIGLPKAKRLAEIWFKLLHRIRQLDECWMEDSRKAVFSILDSDFSRTIELTEKFSQLRSQHRNLAQELTPEEHEAFRNLCDQWDNHRRYLLKQAAKHLTGLASLPFGV